MKFTMTTLLTRASLLVTCLLMGANALAGDFFTYTVTPNPLVFASVAAGTSVNGNLEFRRTGGNQAGTQLISAPCAITGNDAANFSVQTAFPLTLLDRPGVTPLAIRFSTAVGTAPGIKEAAITCVPDVLGLVTFDSFPVTLRGTVLGPTLSATQTPPSLSFPATLVGSTSAARDVIITADAANTSAIVIDRCNITGPDAGAFSLNPGVLFPISLNAGVAARVPITFTPTAALPPNPSASMSCTTNTVNGSVTGSTTLTGTTLALSITAALTPVRLSFPATLVGTNSAPQDVLISAAASNTGPILIDSCTISGANAGAFNFNPAFAAVTLNAGEVATLPVRFSPLSALPANPTASITCTTTTPSGTVTGTVDMDGITTPISITAAITPPELVFPPTLVGTNSAAREMVITAAASNTGAMDINACTITGADASAFNINPAFSLVTLNAGITTRVQVRFSPVAGTPLATVAAINCTTSTSGGSVTGTVNLSATTTPLSITAALTPIRLSFPATLVGSNSAPLEMQINAAPSNTGPILINNCSITGANANAFNFNPAFAAVTLNPGEVARLPVRFSPTTALPANPSASVNCTTSTPSGTVTGTVDMDGITTPLSITAALTPIRLSFPATLVGSNSAPLEMQINAAPSNTGPILINNCSITGANANAFNFNPAFAAVTLNPGEVARLPVRFSPTTALPANPSASINCTTSTPSGTVTGTVDMDGITTPISITAAITPPELVFPPTLVGTNSAAPDMVITAAASNTGVIDINACTITGADASAFNFSPAVLPVSLNAGVAARVPVRFSPSVTTPLAATASITCSTSTASGTVTGTVNLSATTIPLLVVQAPALNLNGLLGLIGLLAAFGLAATRRSSSAS